MCPCRRLSCLVKNDLGSLSQGIDYSQYCANSHLFGRIEPVLRRQYGEASLQHRRVLHDAGFSWQKGRSWCATVTVVRTRKAGAVSVTDPDAVAKKPDRSGVHAGGTAGVDRGRSGPYPTHPSLDAHWQETATKQLTLFHPVIGAVRVSGTCAHPRDAAGADGGAGCRGNPAALGALARRAHGADHPAGELVIAADAAGPGQPHRPSHAVIRALVVRARDHVPVHTARRQLAEPRGAGDGPVMPRSIHHCGEYPLATPTPPVCPPDDQLDSALYPLVRGLLAHVRSLTVTLATQVV